MTILYMKEYNTLVSPSSYDNSGDIQKGESNKLGSISVNFV